MFQLEFIRLLSFWSLFIVSSFLSINLYMGLVDSVYDKGIMVFVSVALEGLKILCLTIANTSKWQSLQQRIKHIEDSIKGSFNFFRRKKITNPVLLRDVLDSTRKKRKAAIFYFVYALVAFLSISASFGYVLQTVDRATMGSLIVTSDNTITIYQQGSDNLDRQLLDNQKSIADYNRYIDALDLTDVRFQIKRDTYQKNIDTLQVKITKLLDDKLVLSNKVQDLRLKDTQVVKETKKTMYQLMGETLGISERTIMFILLYLLSILIEIGIFICSPHFEKEDNITARENKPSEQPYIPVQEKSLPPSRKVKMMFRKSGPEEPRVLTTEDDIEIDLDDDKVVAEPIKTEVYTGAVLPPFEEPEPLPLAVVVPETPLVVVVPPNEAGLLKVAEKIKEEDIPVRVPRPITNFERFIDAMFTNKGKTSLKDRSEAADEALIPKPEAIKYFNFLTKTKGNTGFTLIEFRREFNDWYPNYTSEYIKEFVVQNYKGE